MNRIPVSPEMAAFVGDGELSCDGWPPSSCAFLINFGQDGCCATVRFLAHPTRRSLGQRADGEECNDLIFLVARPACERIFGGKLRFRNGSVHHLDPQQRSIAMAIRDCDLPQAAAEPYRIAKCIELLCEILIAAAADRLIPIGQNNMVSLADGRRLLAARRMIEERWCEKLTLDRIARACGINRAKLTRGFRDMFSCSVADAITNQRLRGASEMLLSTDLPISMIAYRCGYLNNASFSRAFARGFGLAPSQYRTRGVRSLAA